MVLTVVIANFWSGWDHVLELFLVLSGKFDLVCYNKLKVVACMVLGSRLDPYLNVWLFLS